MLLKTYIISYIICCGIRDILATGHTRPNIIIIMADDLGFNDVSFRGGKQFLTPNIDALAYHGKIIHRFYTPPVCSPSRATLLTGLYPIHTGTQHFVLSNEEPWGLLENVINMPQILQLHGYSTNLVGKWHLGFARKEYTPIYKGFDHHFGYWGGFIDYYHKRSKMPKNYSMGYDFRRNLDLMCPPPGSYVTDLLTQEAENIIRNNKAKKPLFLMVSHLAAHAGNDDEPLQAPRDEIKKFNYIPDLKRRTYAAMVSKLDESVGKIIAALDATDQLENSIILFYSDNGAPTEGVFSNTGSNWPLKGQKYSPWEGGIRVPAAIWSPLIKNQASIYYPPVYVGDWLPTLLAAAGISSDHAAPNIDGLNLWPNLAFSETDLQSLRHSKREIIHMLDDIDQVQSLMMGPFKFINGTTMNAKYDNVLENTEHPDVIDPREVKYANVVKASLASKALAKFDEKPLTPLVIRKLRAQAEVQCGQLKTQCYPLKEECLFNILVDPCEQNNLAKDPQYDAVLYEMRNRVEELRSTSIAPLYGNSCIDADPSKHDCTWTNFLDEPVNDYVLNCNYNSPPCEGKPLKTDKMFYRTQSNFLLNDTHFSVQKKCNPHRSRRGISWSRSVKK